MKNVHSLEDKCLFILYIYCAILVRIYLLSYKYVSVFRFYLIRFPIRKSLLNVYLR